MSGGYFNHDDYIIGLIAETLRDKIAENDTTGEFSQATLLAFRSAVSYLERAAIYVHRIDWLLSGDDSEGTFHRRLQENRERYYAGEGAARP